MRHFLSAADLTREAALGLFALAAEDKKRRKSGQLSTPLAGKTFALIFEKPSLRTRVTFEVGMTQLGGHVVYLTKKREAGERRCLLCIRRGTTNGKRPKR